MAPRNRGDLSYVVFGQDRATTSVVGVLHADQAGRRPGGALFEVQMGLNPPWVQAAIIGIEHAQRDTRQGRGGAGFVVEDVTAAVCDRFITRRRVQPQGDLVGHRPRRHEQRRLLGQHRGDPLLQGTHRRVIAKAVVSDHRRGHRRTHRGGRSGDGVTAQIDRLAGQTIAILVFDRVITHRDSPACDRC